MDSTRTTTFRDLMEARGLNPALIAVQTGVSERTVYRALKGKTVNRSTALALARALGESEATVRNSIRAGGK